MKKMNPAHVAAVLRRANTCPYFDLMSMQILSLEPGQSVLEVNVGKKHLQPYGIVHGGVYASLVDAAGFWAAYGEIGEHAGLTTVEMKLNYLAPAAEGRFKALGRCIKVGKTLCLSEATIENENGKMLAHGTVTLMLLHSLELRKQSELPLKFLDEVDTEKGPGKEGSP